MPSPEAEGASLDFLGYTFRWDRSRIGLGHYWNVQPSDKSGARAGQAEGADQRTQQLLADTDADSTTEPVLLIGAVPAWPYSRSWGYYPSGFLGLVLLIVLLLFLTGRL